MKMYKFFLKPLFFLLPPEQAHHVTLWLFSAALSVPGVGWLIRRYYALECPQLACKLWGLHFKNPVGLAAGFDKDGRYYRLMAALGFGFVETGTVTPRPQLGNPKPRLFRLPKDRALINRLGFNNEGADALAQRLRLPRPAGLIIGGNIGKNKDTPNERAAEDYIYCFEKLFPYVDYFAVNVSSPNTPGLRDLQEKEPLTRILQQLQALNRQKPVFKPILLKIAPDLTDTQLDDIIEIVRHTNIAGVIATNTTVSRTGLQENTEQIGAGGLSGVPLRARATQVIRYLHQKSGGQMIIIGVGGITNAADALEKLQAGATLVQLYTGLVYEGPSIVKSIKKGLLKQFSPIAEHQ